MWYVLRGDKGMSDLISDSCFCIAYGKISGMHESKVVELLEIQNKQCTKYSRVKTCLALWNIQQTKLEIEKLRKEIKV
jgi:hypothetical protein